MSQNIRSRVFNLEQGDIPHKIDEVIHESVRKAIHVALQAPLQDCFRELPKADMKEILYPDELLTKMDKSRKRRPDGQDRPPSPPDLDLSKRRRHDTNASGSSQPQAPHSSSIEVSVAPKVGAAAVASPVRVLKLDTHSSLKADPSESLPPPVSIAPMVLPFLCSDDLESDIEMPERYVSPTPHDVMLTRWRSRVASRSSSPTTFTLGIHAAPILPAPFAIVASSSEFPLAPIFAPPRIRQRRAILIRPRENIPIGQIYRTHPGRPCRDIEDNATAIEVAVARDVVAKVDAGIDMEVDAVKLETFFGKTIFT
uniref:Uncharacterized protein n=1 Tax=Tanacetum cinerariifolium TaxID=118510 RepID=A0A699GMC8_TANCI|nr:hypothetical protein [Tanacetum cinerariifolium]